MNLIAIRSNPGETEADAIVVGVPATGELPGPAAEVDRRAGGVLTTLRQRQEFGGKLGESLSLWSPAGIAAPQVVLAGLGERLDRQAAWRAGAAAARHLARKKRQKAAFFLDDGWPADVAQSAVAGAIAGCQGQDLYRAEKSVQAFDELLWAGNEQDLTCGAILGESVNLTRRLVNEPPQAIYPDSFARHAAEVAGRWGLEIEIWDQKRLEAERCGSLLAVAKGSSNEARLVIMRYRGGDSTGPVSLLGRSQQARPVLALVGKGVTFDSGGLSLKESEGMKTMKCDMAGAATVLGAMQAIARLRLPGEVLGLMGLVENMPGPAAMKLGDVLTARSGKTIEVLNTDAEGRLVLADVLNVAVERGAQRIVDLATLTGACVVALGNDVAGLMSNDQSWCDTVAAAARTCGEAVWQLPMYDEYREQIKSEVADIKNVGEGRWGGAITAAKFLEEFVAGVPWAHLDIAGPAFVEKPKPWLEGGASGAFVRTLVELVNNCCKPCR